MGGSSATELHVAPGRVLALVQGDITRIPADAIVNAANCALSGGGGVDGAIHRAGGLSLMAELRSRYRGCPTGSAVVTAAGDLPARWVIHAVGPIWRDGSAGEEGLLRSAYQRAMALADELGARTVTLPAISCGIYGYPLPDGARVALESARAHVAGDTGIERATFVLFSAQVFEAFARALASISRILRAPRSSGPPSAEVGGRAVSGGRRPRVSARA